MSALRLFHNIEERAKKIKKLTKRRAAFSALMSSSRATRPLSPARSKVSHADSTRAQSSVPSLASLDEQLPSASPFNAQMASFYNVRRRQEIAELVVTGREHGFTALAVRRRGSMLSCHCRPPLLLLCGCCAAAHPSPSAAGAPAVPPF